MDDSNRLAKYRKDPASENRLANLNSLLQPFEAQVEPTQPEEKYPLIFIVGCPRSGTTILSQLLASSRKFAYVSNFVARFWQAPVLGAHIGLALGLALLDQQSNLESAFGQTKGWNEPHEFGYFWDRWFRFGETAKVSQADLAAIDKQDMRKAFLSLQGAFDMPMFFKNQNKYSLQIDFLADLFPLSIFVWVRRNPLYQTQSVLLSREKFCGSMQTWWTMKPAEYECLKNLPPVEQVAGQTFYLENAIGEQFDRIGSSRCLTLPYDAMCSDPRCSVLQIMRLAAMPEPAQDDVFYRDVPAVLQSTNKQILSPEIWESLQAALKKFSLM